MFLIRLFLLFFVGMMIRRLFRSIRSKAGKTSAQESEGVRQPGGSAADKPDYKDLTEQGIDDADFEEIP